MFADRAAAACHVTAYYAAAHHLAEHFRSESGIGEQVDRLAAGRMAAVGVGGVDLERRHLTGRPLLARGRSGTEHGDHPEGRPDRQGFPLPNTFRTSSGRAEVATS